MYIMYNMYNVPCRYERALVYMHKMPRIWLEYLELLVGHVLVRVNPFWPAKA
jgi:hypothetical protein